MKRSALIFTAALLAALIVFFAGCDPRGSLKESETQRLYDEFKELAASEEFWQRETHLWLDRDWESDDEERGAVEFVRVVVEKAISDETEKTLYGDWFSSKKYCSSVTIMMDGAVRPNDEREGVRSKVVASKYGDGKWVIRVEDIEPVSDTWDVASKIEFR